VEGRKGLLVADIDADHGRKKLREMPKSQMPRHYPSVSTSWGSAGAARENAGGADGSKRLIASGGRWHCILSDFGDD